MRLFLVSAALAFLATAGTTVLLPSSAAASVEQCSNGLYNANHPTECAGITPGDAIGQNAGDTAGPGSYVHYCKY
ncbi:MAG TPA: hypothetical protein VIL84_04210 [Devosiaceae bacterium]